MASSSTQKPNLKLRVDNARRKVLYAIGRKEAVDFLVSILQLSVGDVVCLLNHQSMVGSLGNLYESVQKMDDSYMMSNVSKSHLQAPKLNISAISGNSPAFSWKELHPNLYICGNEACSYNPDPSAILPYFAYQPATICPVCSMPMGREITYTPPDFGESQIGYVKDGFDYVITDDLSLVPYKFEYCREILDDVATIDTLEEISVDLDVDKAREIIKVSMLQPTSILTDVFLTCKRTRI